MADLTLGASPRTLTVVLVADSPFASVVRRTDAAWTAPPVLTFSDGSTWTSTLATDPHDAAFGETAAQVALKIALPDKAVSLSVGGVVWARGGTDRR